MVRLIAGTCMTDYHSMGVIFTHSAKPSQKNIRIDNKNVLYYVYLIVDAIWFIYLSQSKIHKNQHKPFHNTTSFII